MQMKTWNKVRTSLLRRNKYDRNKRMDVGANSKKGYGYKNNNLSILRCACAGEFHHQNC